MGDFWKEIQIGYPHYLKNGQMIISSEDVHILTILGSCVSVIFYHPQSNTGCIGHSLLPDRREQIDPPETSPEYNPLNYTRQAVIAQLERLSERNIDRQQLIVHIYGGGYYPQIGSNTENGNVGFLNVRTARDTLSDYGLKVHYEDVLGRIGRKVLFNPLTGVVKINPISMENNGDFHRKKAVHYEK